MCGGFISWTIRGISVLHAERALSRRVRPYCSFKHRFRFGRRHAAALFRRGGHRAKYLHGAARLPLFRVGVIGLGRVGLPHALVSAEAGNQVIGVDVSLATLRSLAKGLPHFAEPQLTELLAAHLDRRFSLAERIAVEDDVDVVVIAVGMGYDAQRGCADFRPLDSVFESLVPVLGGKLVVLRTTVPLGTTDRYRQYLEQGSGLREGRDFHLVFCPERLMEGQAIQEERGLPKIIGAFGDSGFDRARRYFESIGGEIVRVRDPSTAELVKLVDNAWRQLRFGFSNDLALLCEQQGLDVLEVVRSANQGYRRNSIAEPSCGVSGYCLTKDPHLLELAFAPVAQARGFGSVWYSARASNDHMVRHTFSRALELSREYKPSIRPIRVLVAGLSFKGDCGDFRMSHGVELARLLGSEEHFEVTVFDPYLDAAPDDAYVSLPAQQQLDRLRLSADLEDSMVGQDVAIFTVPHREFVDMAANGGLVHLSARARKPLIVIDGWNIFARCARSRDHGIVYRGIGRE
jgi:nucleotide sugar dehydrogenase